MSIKQKIDLARQELLDMGLRSNPLLNYRSNAISLDIIDERSAQVFDLLVLQNRPMRFLPVPAAYADQKPADQSSAIKDDSESPALPPLQDYLALEGSAGRHEDNYLQTRLVSEKLDLALLKIENEANTLLQEQGIEVLYLAMGFLTWFEDAGSSTPRYAPLILLPVELKRSSAKDVFSIGYTQADLGPNLALAAKLKGEFRIELPSFDDELNPDAYFQAVQDAVSSQGRWQVQANAMALGLFSFGKFQMFTDLDDTNWPGECSLLDHPLLARLFDKGFLQDTELLASLGNHPSLREPEAQRLVKDADSSQTEAILAVMGGSSLVIQGPPGTGKSQTITNIISEALARGLKVLFVAQKMAALEVVKKRLDECHLGDAVLELHSHKSTKKAVLESIKNTFGQGRPAIPDRQQHYNRLKEVRQIIDDYVAAIRAPILNSGFNYVEALGKYLQLQKQEGYESLPELPFEMISQWGPEALASGERAVIAVAEHIDHSGKPGANPFFLTSRTVLSPVEEQQISKLVSSCGRLLDDMVTQADKFADAMALPQAQSIAQVEALYRAAIRAMEAPKLEGVQLTTDDWQMRRDSIRQLISAGTEMQKLFQFYKDHFIEQAFDAVVLGIRQGLVGRVDKWWRIFSVKYWRSKSALQGYCKQPLKGKPTEWLAWVDDLLAYQSSNKRYSELQALGESLFGAQWQGKASDWDVLSMLSEWLFKLYDDIGAGAVPEGITNFLAGRPTFGGWDTRLAQLNDLVVRVKPELQVLMEVIQLLPEAPIRNFTACDIELLEKQVNSWLETGKLYEAARFNQLKADLVMVGLAPLATLAEDWETPTKRLLLSLQVCYFGGLVNNAYGNRTEIQRFDRITHERLIKEFRNLDASLFDYAKESLVTHLYDSLPNDHCDSCATPAK